MGNPKLLRKKLVAVLKAAICGFLLSEGLILLDQMAYVVWRHGHNEYVHDLGLHLAVILAYPAIYLREVIGLKSGLVVNSITVDGIIGAFIGTLAALFWQFLVKGDFEKSESKSPGDQMDDHR